MKTLTLPLVSGFADIDKFAASAVDCVQWPEAFPYKPEVKIRAAHDADSLLVRFNVVENGLRAVCTDLNGPVWEDDCVELFVKTPGSGFYYNFETNCIGIGLVSRRVSREECVHFDDEAMAKVGRCSSVPLAPVNLEGEQSWSLELKIPFCLLDCGPKPELLEANFYKCGDKTAVPHFLCWNPVETPKPDFHRPEFFGRLILEW